MKKRIVALIIVLVSIICILGLLLFNEYRKYNTPYLKSITIFGQDVEILPNVYVYNIHMKSAKINKVSGGCESPYIFEVNDIFKKKYKETGENGVNYVVDGEDYAYFYLNFENYDVDKGKVTRIDAKYYFFVAFDTPLEIDDFCTENK